MTVKQYIQHKGQLGAAFAAALGFPLSDMQLFRLTVLAGKYGPSRPQREDGAA